MSSTILRKCSDIFHKRNIAYVKRSIVNNRRHENLSDFIRRIRREKELPLEQVVRNSGNLIAGSYINRIENGLVANPSTAKLKAIAKGLGISDEEIFAVARGKALDETSLESANLRAFLADVERLNPVDKAYFMETLKIFHNEVRARLEKYDTPAAKATTERDLDLEAFVDYIWQLHPEIEIATICYVLENRLEHLGGVAMEDVDTIRSLHAEFTNKTVIKNSA
jgi:transcriptional regulator with XRE-family HTH domain